MGKLTSKTVESIAKAATPGKTNDGDGLYFQVSKSGCGFHADSDTHSTHIRTVIPR